MSPAKSMLSVTQQLVVLSVLFLSALWWLRRTKRDVPRWGWIALDFVPVLVAWIGAWLGGLMFHELVRIKFDENSLPLLWAGAQLTALLPALFWGRTGAIVAGSWLCVLSALLLGDTWYYRFFGGLPSVLAIGSGGQIWEIKDSALDVMVAGDAVFLVLLFVGVALAIWWPSKPVIKPPVRAACAALLTVAFWIGSEPVRADVEQWMNTRYSWKVFNSSSLVRDAGIWGAHARETARSVREIRQTEDLQPERFATVRAYHQDPARRKRTPHFGTAAGANVLLVQVEALQQWALDADINGQPIMPFLRGLQQQGVYYTNVWDQTGGSPTSDCEYMVLNSQHPLQQGAVAFRRAGNTFVALPSVVAEHGYTTLSAHGYAQAMWNRSVLHPRYGFQHSAFAKELGSKPRMGWGLSDEAFFERSLSRLQELREPWFGFLITLTSHHPYNYIPASRRTLQFQGLGSTLGGYVHSMHYVDQALKKLVQGLEKAGLRDRTLLVVYGDHDSKVKFGGSALRAAERQINLSKEALRELGRRSFAEKKVPLLIVPPRSQGPKTVTAIGGQIDIGPTVLDWLGYERPNGYIGRALADQYEGDAAPCDSCGSVARYDGSGVNREYLWDANREKCYQRSTNHAVNDARCEPLRRSVEKELGISWDVTLHDLASKLDAQAD